MDGLINPEPLSTSALVLNMLIGILLSLIVAVYYARFGEALSNRPKFARLLPLLAVTTVFVISVVKASLALSLGLVGALSIVRFRTAIKDPEELLYLFLAIAIGLGLGADQRIPSVVAVALVLLVLIGIRIFSPRGKYRNLYLNIQVPNESESSAFQMVNEVLVAHAKLVDLRRLDHHSEMLQMTYNLQFRDQKELVELMDHLRERIPDSSFSFVDQKALPGV
jgi:uncharacterized membrane protein YhiD involved in acid resistance